MTTLRALAIWLAVSLLPLLAQTPDLAPDTQEASVPTVAFDFVLPGSSPAHYALAVASTGRAAYRSDRMADDSQRADEPYSLRFVASEATLSRVFELAKALNYFRGNFEYGTGKIANLGAKTLTFRDGERSYQTKYNYSTNVQIQELTRLFQNISNTLEFGRRLEYLYRYDKLGLDAELKRMEEAAKSETLAELQVVQPILEKIAGNPAIINIARRRASHLLARVPGSLSGAQTSRR